MKIEKNKIFIICYGIWFLYLVYTIIISFFDIYNIKQIQWKQAKNVSSIYNGYKASIVTKAYKKLNVKIERQYGYFSQGLNVWLGGIDKKADYEDISFYVKKRDYDKVINNMSSYNSVKKQEDVIPFFGLRKINFKPNIILLFLDIWKYNYIIYSILIVFFIPYIIIYLCNKLKIELVVDKKLNLENINIKYPLSFIFITIIFYSLV